MNVWRLEEPGAEWRAVEIPPGGLALSRSVEESLVLTTNAGEGLLAVVVPFAENGRQHAALVAAPQSGETVLLNGYTIPAGVALLRERDEIVVAGEVMYFSAGGCENRAPFPDNQAETRCSRCRAVVSAGDMALRCVCGAIFHEGPLAGDSDEPRSCGSYEPSCNSCGRLWAELAWNPGDEDE